MSMRPVSLKVEVCFPICLSLPLVFLLCLPYRNPAEIPEPVTALLRVAFSNLMLLSQSWRHLEFTKGICSRAQNSGTALASGLSSCKMLLKSLELEVSGIIYGKDIIDLLLGKLTNFKHTLTLYCCQLWNGLDKVLY